METERFDIGLHTNDVRVILSEIRASNELYMYGFLRHIAAIVKETARQVVIADGAVATGRLRDSFKSDIKKVNVGLAVAEYTLTVYSTSPYAKFVDKGTRPHFPPLASLAEWIRRKRQRGAFKILEKDVDRVAYLIARSIARRGLKERKLFFTTRRAVEPILRREIAVWNAGGP